MGRLIDADALFPNGVFLVDEKNPMKSITELINRIANAPTAYDVKKVVAELEELKTKYNKLREACEDVIDAYELECKCIQISKDIDIVKRGGVE